MTARSETQATGLLWAVAWVSAAVLGFEIALMRVLLVASWHHFAFLVISVALLGFGASGTALCLVRNRLMPYAGHVLGVLALGTAASMPLCTALAQHVPIEARFVPALLWRQVGCWAAYWGILAIPFFLGAATVGLGLMMAGQGVARIYAGNLMGSAAGGVLAMVGMEFIPAEWLSVGMGGLALVGAAGLRLPPLLPYGRARDLPAGQAGRGSFLPRPGLPVGRGRVVVHWGGLAACGLVVAIGLWLDPPRVRPDPYKYAAYLQRLERQGSAERVGIAFGPRSVVEAYQGDVFHEMAFLAVGTAPPPMLALTIDGHWAGSVLRIATPAQARVVDRTLMAFPYAIAPERPRVLLLGESGGANIWLAVRQQAASIQVVQPDRKLVGLLRGPLRDRGGSVFDQPGVRVAITEPRHFVEHEAGRYDLIQLVTLEGTAAGTGGIGGLAQDHLVTVEGISACLRRLAGRGLLFACRGIQTPPRDNVKLLATFVEALRRNAIAQPSQHVVIVRDYLAVCTVVQASPWTPEQIARVRAVCAERQLTPVWFPGIRADELNHPDALPEPPEGPGDWYHYAARRLFSPAARAFFNEWPFAVRPATDDRPFFLDFCKLRSLGELKRTFGDLWLTRTELAFLFVAGATLFVGGVGAALTLLPLGVLRTATTFTRRGVTVGYFTAIGLAYLCLEMTFLSRLTHLIGDPVRAAAVTISTFLLASGLGSLTAQRCSTNPERTLRIVFVILLMIGALELAVLAQVTAAAGSLAMIARSAVAVAVIAPLAYVMGFPMPVALARLDRGAKAMIPWAWGVNGFASVLAAPLATLIGMTWGFRAAGVVALLLYLVASVLFPRLPRGQ